MAPKYERQSPELPDNWTSGNGLQGQSSATCPDWQDVVVDGPMRRLVELALENNRDLRVAAMKVEKAKAQHQIMRADLFPKLDASAGANTQRTPSSLSGTGVHSISRKYSVEQGLSFELDIFGRIQSLKEQALEDFLATEATRRSVRLSLVAEVATSYLTLASDREHLFLAFEILNTELESYELIRQRTEAGLANTLDLKRAQTTVDTARVTVAKYRAQVTADENLLAVLVGQPLPPESLPAKTLAGVMPLNTVPAGLPSEVLSRRPDVLTAEHQLKAANANIGAARARYFPSISLTGSYGTASDQVHDLFKNSFQTWNYFPQITLPIFHGGAIKAGVESAEAERGIMLAQYDKAIQTAFKEVSDCLALGTALEKEVRAQESLSEAAGATYKLATQRYDAGIDDYLSKLDAQRTYATSRQDLISLRLEKSSNTMMLYKTLGGGWNEQETQN